MVRSNPEPYPRAVRHLVRIKPLVGAGQTIYNGWLNVEVDTPDRFFGSTGLSPDGYDLTLEIIQHDSATHPIYGDHGIELVWTYSHTGFPNFFVAWWFPSDGAAPVSNMTPAMLKQFQLVGSFGILRTDYDPLVNTDFTDENMHRSWEWWSLSECWEFPAPPVGGMAEFNGVDTSIVFDQFCSTTDARYQLEFDVRFRDVQVCAILARTNSSLSWVNVNVTGISWKQFPISFASSLNLNQWYTIRLEYNWNDPGTGRKLYLDGVLDAHLPGSGNVTLFFNQMGKKGATYLGDFDAKLLTLLDTDPGSPRVVMDIALQVDACDVGEKSMKGTTENMTLPSCP